MRRKQYERLVAVRGYAGLVAYSGTAGLLYNRRSVHRIGSILVLESGDLGDAVLATAVVKALRVRFPNARIDVCAKPHLGSLFSTLPGVDRILTREQIRTRGAYDLAVDLNYFPDWGIMLRRPAATLLHRADSIVATRFTRGRTFVHELQAKLRILKALGLDRLTVFPTLRPSVADQAEVAARLQGARLSAADRLVVVQPGAGWPYRRWPAEAFRRVVGHLVRRQHARVIVVGNAEERALAEAVCCEGALNWAGQLSLLQLAALLSRASLFVGNDSGPMHIAAAMRTPVVAIFGPQVPERFAPVGTASIVLHHRLECCPCLQRECIRPHDPCVLRVSPEEVVRAAERLLASRDEAGSERDGDSLRSQVSDFSTTSGRSTR